MKKKSKTVAYAGICVALALIFAYVEVLIPPISSALPGMNFLAGPEKSAAS